MELVLGGKMDYRLEVLVQLPDGTKRYLPIVAFQDDKEKIKTFSSKQEAFNWAEYCLPGKINIIDNIEKE